MTQDWQQQIQQIAQADGRKEVVREAITQYLDRIDPGSVRGVIADLQERVVSLEQFARLG